jgi:hypothetical protein
MKLCSHIIWCLPYNLLLFLYEFVIWYIYRKAIDSLPLHQSLSFSFWDNSNTHCFSYLSSYLLWSRIWAYLTAQQRDRKVNNLFYLKLVSTHQTMLKRCHRYINSYKENTSSWMVHLFMSSYNDLSFSQFICSRQTLFGLMMCHSLWARG